MNRSVDSLDVIYEESSGSSSPTDFTSDDEASTDNLILMSGQQRKKDIVHGERRLGYYESGIEPLNSQLQLDDIIRSFGRPLEMQSLIASPTNNQSQRVQDEGKEIPLTLSAREMRSAMRGHTYGQSSNAPDSDRIYIADEEVDNDLFGRNNESTVSATLPSSGRGVSLAVRLCSGLVECRDLIEAVEFVEQHRELIENLTGIITREAPAFRNYELANYQIDHTVKESFNPNFWFDREPIVTTADGNCQYHAVSISLTGSEAYTPEVRLATAVAVIDNRGWFDSILKLIDRGTVLDLVHTISRSHSWGDETTLKAIAVAINKRIFLYTCNFGKKDYEMVRSLSREELLDAFREKKYRGGTGIHAYADPLNHVSPNNYIMLFHKSDHFIAVLPTGQQPIMFEPYNPIVPVFS